MPLDNDFYRLWQHDNGTWYITWTKESENGQRTEGSRRISTRTNDRREAEQFRAQFLAGLKNPSPKSEPTIGYLLDRYRNEHGVQVRSLETIDYSLKSLKPFFGDLFPSQMTNSLLKEYALINSKEKKVSNGTILRRLGVLKTALSYAEGNRWIERQPPFIMPVKQPAPRDLWYTRDQVNLLLEKAKSPHLRLFIMLGVATAARSAAILELNWSQVDFAAGIINFGRGHGNKRRAIVPMNVDLREALFNAKELAQTANVIEFKGKTVRSIKKSFAKLCKENSIEGSPHILRHTAATWLVMDGVPLSEVARLLGDSERTVEKVYGKHAPDYLNRAVRHLNFKRSVSMPEPKA
ncbi:MAG: tyrosine-type recombinase/integrase [Pseudomonadota bacterium]|nr:tyrosine-type recombinase/integrase [Pseudomonadota bacterium]